jgi:DNA-binding MarR family transcriptional regulator
VRGLCDTLALDPGTLSPLVKRLETAGLVRRERQSRDERLLAVTLTPAGNALRRQAEHVPAQIISRLGLSLADLEQLNAALRAVITAAATT